jgi:[CysO sulfur-carrier protein]-S-L-cysteine hydrolase
VKIIIPFQIKEQLVTALKNAGNHETGGILMGEHVDIDEFRVKEITVEPNLGTFASFVRALSHALSSLEKFFQETKYDYTHYNYMGEWHSHPSFVPAPSTRDISTMIDSINDKNIGANFLVLIIIKLNTSELIEGSATVFYPNLPFVSCELVFV